MQPIQSWLGKQTCLAMCTIFLLTSQSVHALSYLARAYELDSGDLVYTEHHLEQWIDSELVGAKVEYRDPAGETFATKQLDFTQSRLAPAYVFADDRHGIEETAERIDNRFRLERIRNGKQSKSRLVDLSREIVVDAGFDQLVAENWERVERGGQVKFDFALPSRGLIKFKLRSAKGEAASADRLHLELVIRNRLLRLLVDPIRLEYDRDTRRLISYEGVSNIKDLRGKNFKARILFEYPTSQPISRVHTSAKNDELPY